MVLLCIIANTATTAAVKAAAGTSFSYQTYTYATFETLI